MSSSFGDFDVASDPPKPKEVEAPEPAPVMIGGRVATAAETLMVQISQALNTFITQYIPKLNGDQLHALVSAIPPSALGNAAGEAYDENFSLADEISLQIAAVRGLRGHMFPNGRLRDNATIREAKEVLTTSSVMIKTLMDNHDRIMNMERMRAVEAATVDILQEMGEKQKEKFLKALEARLEALS